MKRLAWVGAILAVMCADAVRAASLTGVNVGGPSYYDWRFGYQTLIGQRVSGDSGYWMDKNNPAADSKWMLVNLNGLVTLNTMTVKNRGDDIRMGTASIEYSLDGVSWTTLQASHSFRSDTDDDVISFGNVQTRFIRIGSPGAGYAKGGTDAADRAGLTSLAFDGIRINESLNPVTGVTVTASSEATPWDRYATNTVNGSGLETTDFDSDGVVGQLRGDQYGWQNVISPLDADPWIQWDLGSTKSLHSMLVWNSPGGVGSGADWKFSVKYARVRYSTDGVSWTDLSTQAWFVPDLVISATQGWPAGSEKLNEAFTQFIFSGVQARYVKFDTLMNWNGAINASWPIGLGEVQFFSSSPTMVSGTVFRVQ